MKKHFLFLSAGALISALFIGCGGGSDIVTKTDPDTGKTVTYKVDPVTKKKLDYLTIIPFDNGFSLLYENNSKGKLSYMWTDSAGVVHSWRIRHDLSQELNCTLKDTLQSGARYTCLPNSDGRVNAVYSFPYDTKTSFYSSNNTDALATIQYNSASGQIEVMEK